MICDPLLKTRFFRLGYSYLMLDDLKIGFLLQFETTGKCFFQNFMR